MKQSAEHILSLCHQQKIDWTDDNIKRSLTVRINELIDTDFAALIQLLYRLDVSEQKVKKTLADNPGKDAGELIAALITERQQQKEITRKNFHQQNDIGDEEKW